MLKTISFKTFWKDSSLGLKAFTAITVYSIVSELWSLLFHFEYISNLRPFGFENNALFNYIFYTASLIMSVIFLIAIFTKSQSLFRFYFYYSVIYIPAALFLTWMNGERSQIANIFYLFFILFMGLILLLLYQQKKYFNK